MTEEELKQYIKEHEDMQDIIRKYFIPLWGEKVIGG